MHQAAQRHFRIFGHDAQIAVQIAVGERLPFFHQRDVVLQNARGANHVGLVAFDFERIIHQAGGDIQPVLQHPNIFVAGSEQGLDAARDLNA